MVKVIYASYSKCATKSIAAAFRLLGYNVYDWSEHLMHNRELWFQFLDPNLSRPEKLNILYEMYKDVDVVMAMPVYVFWKEFLEVFPEAKVVHYPREVEAWQRSSQVQLKELIKVKRFPDEISYFFMRFFAPETYRCHLWQDRCNKLIIGQEFDGFYTLKNGRMQADQLLNGVRYRTHNADVELNCPKEKILVLSKTTVRS